MLLQEKVQKPKSLSPRVFLFWAAWRNIIIIVFNGARRFLKCFLHLWHLISVCFWESTGATARRKHSGEAALNLNIIRGSFLLLRASQLSSYAIIALLQAAVCFLLPFVCVCVCVQQMYFSLVYNYACKHFWWCHGLRPLTNLFLGWKATKSVWVYTCTIHARDSHSFSFLFFCFFRVTR